eukprot:GHVP01009874.1.p1 GENE.GHVP01009874.1~~GHVP01009874.1.p1  ORF type:complete len:115 (-),score=11.65 GHVP01009874.1:14-358(-)
MSKKEGETFQKFLESVYQYFEVMQLKGEFTRRQDTQFYANQYSSRAEHHQQYTFSWCNCPDEKIFLCENCGSVFFYPDERKSNYEVTEQSVILMQEVLRFAFNKVVLRTKARKM